jgi:hypothetical protein
MMQKALVARISDLSLDILGYVDYVVAPTPPEPADRVVMMFLKTFLLRPEGLLLLSLLLEGMNCIFERSSTWLLKRNARAILRTTVFGGERCTVNYQNQSLPWMTKRKAV